MRHFSHIQLQTRRNSLQAASNHRQLPAKPQKVPVPRNHMSGRAQTVSSTRLLSQRNADGLRKIGTQSEWRQQHGKKSQNRAPTRHALTESRRHNVALVIESPMLRVLHAEVHGRSPALVSHDPSQAVSQYKQPKRAQ